MNRLTNHAGAVFDLRRRSSLLLRVAPPFFYFHFYDLFSCQPSVMMYYIVMNDINKGNYEALAGEYEEQQTVLREEQELKAPYHMGAGFLDKLKEWADKNLPSDFKADWESEATISLNVSGGQPSQHYNKELFRAVKAYNSGETYETPRIEWNKMQEHQELASVASQGVPEQDMAIQARHAHMRTQSRGDLDMMEVRQNAIDEESIRAKDERRRAMESY